jgi:hypothetical protein
VLRSQRRCRLPPLTRGPGRSMVTVAAGLEGSPEAAAQRKYAARWRTAGSAWSGGWRISQPARLGGLLVQRFWLPRCSAASVGNRDCVNLGGGMAVPQD